jgi:multidrug efflux pump subunit AcrB
MQGAARALFVPLSLAVGLAMIASYVLSSTLVPVLSVWLLLDPKHGPGKHAAATESLGLYGRLVAALVAVRWLLVPAYLAGCGFVIVQLGGQLGREIFPAGEAREFRLRLRAPDGTHFEATERYAVAVLDEVAAEVGRENIARSLGYVGTIPPSFPINAVYQWSRGPEEGILRIALRPGAKVDVARATEALRTRLAAKFPKVRFAFEPPDIISETMSFGAAPIEISVRGGTADESRGHLLAIRDAIVALPAVRDVQVGQSLDYPAIEVKLDRERASDGGTTAAEVARSVVAATSSTRFLHATHWPDPKTGVGYQVQIELAPQQITRAEDLGTIPVHSGHGGALLLQDVAQVSSGSMPGQYDRYNMKRELTLTASIAGEDLGAAELQVRAAIAALDARKPKPVSVELRGQIPPLRQIQSGLGFGLVLALLAILLLLTASFQSLTLAVVTMGSAPAALAGVILALRLTGDTLNLQSFIGAIMALAVAMANSILLTTFAREELRATGDSRTAAVRASSRRLRAILMTSLAMGLGMAPMALGLGEGGGHSAPLGRAVLGGLVAGAAATLFILPSLYAMFTSPRSVQSASLDATDVESPHYLVPAVEAPR